MKVKEKLKKAIPWAVALLGVSYGVYEHCKNEGLKGELKGAYKVSRQVIKEATRQSYRLGKTNEKLNNAE